MNTTLEEKMRTASDKLAAIGRNAIKHPISSILSLCMIAGMAAMTGAFSQDGGQNGGKTGDAKPAIETAERHQTKLPLTRVITSSDGRTMAGTITAVDGGVIRFRRVDDGRTVDIPLNKLSAADQKFVETWDPPSSYRPSSVSIAGNSSLTRGSYPSRYQPQYSGGSGGPRGYRVYRQSCTGRTVVVPCRTVVVPCR